MRGILTRARLVLDLLSMKVFVELFGRGDQLLDSPPGDDDPLEAAAMAMPVRRPPIHTNAVSGTRMRKAGDVDPSGLLPSPSGSV